MDMASTNASPLAEDRQDRHLRECGQDKTRDKTMACVPASKVSARLCARLRQTYEARFLVAGLVVVSDLVLQLSRHRLQPPVTVLPSPSDPLTYICQAHT